VQCHLVLHAYAIALKNNLFEDPQTYQLYWSHREYPAKTTAFPVSGTTVQFPVLLLLAPFFRLCQCWLNEIRDNRRKEGLETLHPRNTNVGVIACHATPLSNLEVLRVAFASIPVVC